ncbi:MAG: universal stress protein [Bacillota bacterium]
MYNRILVAVDGSENALRAVREAVRMAQGNPDAQISMITAVPLANPVFGYTPLITPQQVEDAERKAEAEVLKKAEEVINQTKQAAELAKKEGLNVQSLVQVGDPAQTIIEYAAKENQEVIVMGRRGMGVLKELLLGSVSGKVLQSAPCPVLLVH